MPRGAGAGVFQTAYVTLTPGIHLTGADLRMADLSGADLRAAELDGADLTTSLFLTQSQLDAAKGGLATRLAARFTRPAHWRS